VKTPTVEGRSQTAATLTFVISTLLVAGDAPAWAVAVALLVAAWRVLVSLGFIAAPRPRKGMRFLFGVVTALLVGAVLMSFRTLNGLAAGTALLVLMGALKLAESRARRDDGIVIGVSLFLLLAAALANQAMSRAPLYLLQVWVACAAMMIVAHPGGDLRVRAAMRLSARALALAVPLAVACFLLFPRIGGQFWALPRDGQATTGLSDSMSPTAIDELVANYDPAFRAKFEGPLPPPEFRYWRGPVLNSFDGFTWRRERGIYYPATRVEPVGEPLRYRITMEPTHRNWLFSLDTVDRSPRNLVHLSHDRVLWRSEPVSDTLSYDASSHLRTVPLGPLATLGRRHETRLPADRNPRALALARELRGASADDAAYARRVLDWFASNGLEYTLEPGRGGVDSVDHVLFVSRKGFCGHFASSYATLMRAAGIPARVVTGYLGGEWNPIGGYLIVRQSDAHAWTEIWLEGQGWTRVDPTAVVAPERINRGVYDVLDGSASVAVSLRRAPWLARLGQYWDGMNTWWRDRVLDFNLRSQLEFLRSLGIDAPDWRHLGWGFAGVLLLWLAWITTTLRRSVARVKPDRLARAWIRATRKLERVTTPRAASEGAMSYAQRVASAHPPLAAAVLDLATRYTRLRFGPAANDDEVRDFERDVRRLAV
jgi:transglutaminase-like putative cysteine protease